MGALLDKVKTLWGHLSQGRTSRPIHVSITSDRVDAKDQIGGTLTKDQSYFQVKVNQLYLATEREWFSRYDPMVLVVSEFIYDKDTKEVPFVVGPSMLEKYKDKIPQGMVFENTRVAGLHPFRGGRLNLTVVLCRVKVGDYARDVLNLVDQAAHALDFSSVLTGYLKVSDLILGGIGTLFKMKDLEPQAGHRNEFDADGKQGKAPQPGYFALVDQPEGELNPELFWVRDSGLCYGPSLENAEPFRGADFLLYSIEPASSRSDERLLSFYPLWSQVIEAAAKPGDEDWKRAKASMLALYQAMALSSDLNWEQANALSDRFVTDMKTAHEKAAKLGSLSGRDPRLSEAVKILDL